MPDPLPAEDRRITAYREAEAFALHVIKEILEPEVDYRTITIERDGETVQRLSLLKSGAERLCAVFDLIPLFSDDLAAAHAGGGRAVAYRCHLHSYDKAGPAVGEGGGAALLSESFINGNMNVAVKMALKRAQVDAVIRTLHLSAYFTQDLEDPAAPAEATPTGRVYGARARDDQPMPETAQDAAAELQTTHADIQRAVEILKLSNAAFAKRVRELYNCAYTQLSWDQLLDLRTRMMAAVDSAVAS
jgi:hypothetical protein